MSSVDTLTDEKSAEVKVGDDPRMLALSADGRFLFIANQRSATVTVMDANNLRVLASTPVDAEPYGIVADPGGRLLYVASSAADVVDVLMLSEPLRIFARIPVGPKPKGLAVSPDGSLLYVTHFLSGEVSVIDTARRQVLRVISTGIDSNMAQQIVLDSANARAYLPHIRSNVTNHSLLFDSTIFPVVSVIDLSSTQALPQERIDLSVGIRSVNLPFDIALSLDSQRAYVVNFGSGEMSVVDLRLRRRVADVEVGEGPRGIAVTRDGRKAYVLNSLSGDVSVIDLNRLVETKRVKVTASLLPPDVQRGKVFFFSSRSPQISTDRWMSCGSCHFEGDIDGRTWFFPDGGLRNTTSMRGVSDTRPLHWSADRDELQDFELTILDIQAGSGLMAGRDPNPPLGPPNRSLSADLDALAAFIETLAPKSSPLVADRAAIARGQAIFGRDGVGCAACHIPPRYTDSTMAAWPFIRHDVGTGSSSNERMGPAFDTPSLRMLWDSAPYLHDGSAPTLRDVLVTKNPLNRHGSTRHLSEAEIQDLIAFLLSLPAEPSLGVQLNAGTFRAGEPLIVTASLTAGSSPRAVDAYIAVQLPDGQYLSVLPGGRVAPGLVPIAQNFTPFDYTADVFRYTLDGSEPPGSYSWITMLVEPGTLNVVVTSAQVPFTIAR